MRIAVFLVLFILAFKCNSQTLKKIWESDTTLNKPESTIYDRTNKQLYVSNINGKYCTKDGNGFISKIHLDGTIEKLKWITGLDSPQGLGLYKNSLYVADINRIVVIDIINERIENVFKIDSAQFLNDIAADTNGDVYISDCKANKIYKIENNKMGLWLDETLLSGPNGLLCTDQNLFVLNMGNGVVYSINKKTKAITEFCTGIKNCDGIVSDGNNGYFVSGAWQGQIYHLNSKGEKSLILDLGPEKIITADIEYIPENKILLIPTLNKTIKAYTWD